MEKELHIPHLTYTKINTLYKRDAKGNIMLGEYSRPEFEYLHDIPWIAYEKIDGTNMSFYWNGLEMEIHGKTENAQIPERLEKTMLGLLTVEQLREAFPPKYDENGDMIPMRVIIYGEGYGAGIQKGGGRYAADENRFRVFDINVDGWWLELDNVKEICDGLGLEMAPKFGEFTLGEAEEIVKAGFASPVADDHTLIAEGLVLRPLVQLFNRRGERIMVKIKYRDYPHEEKTEK